MMKPLLPALLSLFATMAQAQTNLGLFEQHRDVGNPSLKGNTVYQPQAQTYLLTAGGRNIWGTEDQFQFCWKKIKGDFIIKATVQFLGKGVDGHRKLGVMARDELTATSRYIDGAFHGGEPLNTSLQFRLKDGDTTSELKISSHHPTEIEFERSGNTFTLSAAVSGEPYKSVQKIMELNDEVYAGIYLSAHNEKVREQAIFSNVRIIIPPAKNHQPYRDFLNSHLEVMQVESGERKLLYSQPGSIQCPNWSRDGKYLVYNSAAGLLYRFDLASSRISQINSGFAVNNNNDHVFSFDGKQLAISNYTGSNRVSSIYTMPVTGTDSPQRISSVDSGHSFLHSYSPDGKKILFTGQRRGEWDIYSIDVNTKVEKRLTNAPMLDDGSEYTPDGKWIYFNSVRTGTMQIWKMRADGSEQQQVTFDEYNNWFPHISPNGKWIVYIAYPKEIDPNSHPFYQKVYIKLMPASGGFPKIVGYVYGGQGTMNVPSWSPDSKRIALISNY